MPENPPAAEINLAARQSLEEKHYWLNRLAGEWTKTRFYYDFKPGGPDAAQPGTIKPAAEPLRFNEETQSRLMKMTRGSDAKLHMVLLAVLVLQAHKYTGQDDILVGTPIYRQKTGGEFINTLLPLRQALQDTMSFKELLLEVRQTLNDAVRYQNYPLEKLIYELNLPVGPGDPFPLLEIVLLLENIHDPAYIAHVPSSMIFSFIRSGEVVEGTLEYDTRYYRPGTAGQIAAHYVHLLKETLFGVDTPLSAIEILSGQEKQRLLWELNETRADPPGEKTLHGLLAEQAARTPDHTALVEPGMHLSVTYRCLEGRSAGLARCLAGRGLQPETAAAIKADFSAEMAVAIFGVLKAGAVYLPIDPDYPDDRINYMLADSGAKMLITPGSLEEEGEKVLPATVHRQPATSLAYIIYTSGTTGRPKGVLIEHRSILNYVRWRIREYRQTPADIALQLVSFSFDGYSANFYPTLLSGGVVVLTGQDKWREPGTLRRIIRASHVTHFSLVPALYRVILEGAKKEDFPTLRFVVLAGEGAGAELIRLSRDLLPGVELINEYGPTENAVTTTFNRGMTPGDSAVIGKPIANHSVYILDGRQALKPPGVPGELCAAGPGLARGYLNHPELTSEKFNHDLWDYQKFFRGSRGAILQKSPPGRRRFYKTGDLARWQPDGKIELLGRIDRQVQIRGYRVEPEEIERHLQAHPGVSAAAVIVKTASAYGESGTPQAYNYLCAYIVPGKEFDREEARKYLAARMPVYMVPTNLETLSAMPLTPTGKIDRRRLEEMPIQTAAGNGPGYTAPRTPEEERLSILWTRFLEKEKIGIHDNFFNSGGDSIKSIGLLSLINKEFKTNFQVVDLYENETIAKFAAKIPLNRQNEEKAGADRRREEVVKKIAALQADALATGKLPAREIEDLYPMSDIEKGMLYHTLQGDSGLYYNQVIYRLEQRELQEEILKKALTLLVEKHEILRTGFNTVDFEEAVQIVYKEAVVDFVHEDLTHLSKDRQEAYIRDVLAQDRRRPLEIHRPASLWRVKTYAVDETTLYLIWIGHHALTDGWSSAALVTELDNLYVDLKTRERSPLLKLPRLKAAYKDYVIEELMTKQDRQILEFWKNELVDYKRLEFPGPLKNRPAAPGTKTHMVNLGEPLRDAVTAVARTYNLTLKGICFGAYLYMLGMISYEKDLLVGLVTNNRPGCEDGDKVTGCFLNTVPVRIAIPGPLPYLRYFERIEKKLKELKPYERLTLSEIVKEAGEEHRGRNPFFDTLFNFVDFHIYRQVRTPGQPGEKAKPGRQLNIEGSGSIDTLFNFDVDITMDNFYILLTYPGALIDDDLAANCCGYFEKMLRQFTREPGGILEKASLLAPGEMQKLLIEFNRTETDYPYTRTLPDLYAEQTERTPDHLAVKAMGTLSPRLSGVTYKELNQRSQQLARVLQTKGVGPDTIVALMMERSLEMITGILGILKAGGAYMPIDPGNPPGRINDILTGSGVKILVTTGTLAKEGEKVRRWKGEKVFLEEISESLKSSSYPLTFQETPSKPFIDCGFESSDSLAIGNWQLAIGNSNFSNEFIGLKNERKQSDARIAASYLQNSSKPATSLAYLIYTSGSTGKPKGVLLEHGSAINTVTWFGRQYRVQPGVHVLMMSEYTFDASVNQVFGTLLHGGVLYVIPPHLLTDIPGLRRFIREHHIHILNFVPAYFNELLADREKLGSIRAVISGAEALTEGVKDKILEKGYALYNQYGPSETAIDALCSRCTAGAVTLGKPIANVRCFILDRHGERSPIGIPGELLIAGPGLARGYLNHPELTAEKFFRGSRGAILQKSPPGRRRLYKTGDLARWQPQGDIEFLGRLDRQVKIRGNRVEPGEIENRLHVHSGIKAAVVMDREDSAGGHYLCAYVEPRPGSPVDAAALKEYLSRSLPGYMIPLYFVQVEKIPITPGGKIDLRALPEPGTPGIKENDGAPANALEKILLDIWSQVLGPVGLRDNFFQRGGDSIKAIRAASKLLREGWKLDVKDLFLNPTIKQVAPYVKPVEQLPDQAVEQGEVPLTPIQRWLFQQSPGHYRHFSQAVMLSRPGGFEKEKLEQLFRKLVEHHDALRMVYRWDPDPRGKNREGPQIFPIQENRGIDGKLFDLEIFVIPTGEGHEEAVRLAAERIQTSLEIETGPLVKLGLFKTPAGDHLLIVIHHLVVDGVSWRILLEDIAAGYRQLLQGEPLVFPPKTHSFRYWAQQLAEYAKQGDILKELAYWQALEKNEIEKLPRETAAAEAEKTGGNRAQEHIGLAPGETRLLLQEVHRAYGTEINDLLLTALALAIHRWAGMQKVLINLEGHGREEILENLEISRTVGWYTTRFPVLLPVPRPEDLAYSIKTVKETLRKIPHRGIGYGILKYLTLPGKKGETALTLEPEINFNYLGQFMDEADPGEFQFSPLPTAASTGTGKQQTAALDIGVVVLENRLSVYFDYDGSRMRKAGIEKLAGAFGVYLQEIIRHCTARQETELTPADLDYSNLTLEQLEELENQLGEIGLDSDMTVTDGGTD